jgi:hypothetical protein
MLMGEGTWETLRNMIRGCGLHWFGLRWGPIMDAREHDWASTAGGELLDRTAIITFSVRILLRAVCLVSTWALCPTRVADPGTSGTILMKHLTSEIPFELSRQWRCRTFEVILDNGKLMAVNHQRLPVGPRTCLWATTSRSALGHTHPSTNEHRTLSLWVTRPEREVDQLPCRGRELKGLHNE